MDLILFNFIFKNYSNRKNIKTFKNNIKIIIF